MTTKEFKRHDGRKAHDLRPISAKVGIIPNADGSAMYISGKTIAIAAVYGPKRMHPQHMQNPEKGTLRCNYNMLSFSVTDRIRPGPSRRSTEISKITEWALEPILMIDQFPNMVIDVHINIIPQTDQHVGFPANAGMHGHLGQKTAENGVGCIGCHAADDITRVEILEVDRNLFQLKMLFNALF